MDDEPKNKNKYLDLVRLCTTSFQDAATQIRRMSVEDLGTAIQFLQEALRENPDVPPEFVPVIDWDSLTEKQWAEIRLHDSQIKSLIQIMRNEVRLVMEKRADNVQPNSKRPGDPKLE